LLSPLKEYVYGLLKERLELREGSPRFVTGDVELTSWALVLLGAFWTPEHCCVCYAATAWTVTIVHRTHDPVQCSCGTAGIDV
jgi:hypothetical protein